MTELEEFIMNRYESLACCAFFDLLILLFFNPYKLASIQYQWGPIEIEFANK